MIKLVYEKDQGSGPTVLRKLVPVFLQGKVFYILMPKRMICPVEQSLQVNPFFLILFNIEDPYHLFNFVGLAIKPKETIKPKKNTQL